MQVNGEEIAEKNPQNNGKYDPASDPAVLEAARIISEFGQQRRQMEQPPEGQQAAVPAGREDNLRWRDVLEVSYDYCKDEELGGEVIALLDKFQEIELEIFSRIRNTLDKCGYDSEQKIELKVSVSEIGSYAYLDPDGDISPELNIDPEQVRKIILRDPATGGVQHFPFERTLYHELSHLAYPKEPFEKTPEYAALEKEKREFVDEFGEYADSHSKDGKTIDPSYLSEDALESAYEEIKNPGTKSFLRHLAEREIRIGNRKNDPKWLTMGENRMAAIDAAKDFLNQPGKVDEYEKINEKFEFEYSRASRVYVLEHEQQTTKRTDEFMEKHFPQAPKRGDYLNAEISEHRLEEIPSIVAGRFKGITCKECDPHVLQTPGTAPAVVSKDREVRR